MSLKMSTKLKNVMNDSIKTALAAGVIKIYTGSQPADANAAPTGTLLGTVTVGSGAFTHGVSTNGLDFDASSGSVLSKAAAEVWSFVAVATGTAGWFRHIGNAADSEAVDTATYPRIDGRISTSGAEMSLSNLNVVTGATTTVDSYTISWPSTL